MAMGKVDVNEKSQSRSKRKEKEVLPTKVVIRRLPGSLTEEQLKAELAGIPEHDYFRFVPKDNSLMSTTFARAYINFKRFDDVALFRNSFDGYIFNAGKGDESSAVVEVAPYQGIPKDGRRRKDLKSGTILKDPDYEAFLENLSKKVEPLPSAEVYVEAMETSKAAGSADKPQTPLVEYLNKKKAARNLSRQNALALENERKAKREKELAKESSKSKNDDRSPGKDFASKNNRPDSNSGKGSQDKRGQDSRRKEERRERRNTPGKKNRNERDTRDNRDQKRDDDRPLSARSDSSRHSEGRTNRREDRRSNNDRRNADDRRNRDDRTQRRSDEQKKSGRPDTIKEEEKRSRRKSIEYEDPSIVAFGKAVDSKESGKFGKGSGGRSDSRGKDEEGTGKQRGGEAEKSRGRDSNADDDRKTKNKERPTMAVYRPPVARHDRGKGKDERSSPEKSRIKSPDGVRSPEGRRSPEKKGYSKDRPRPYQKEESQIEGGCILGQPVLRRVGFSKRRVRALLLSSNIQRMVMAAVETLKASAFTSNAKVPPPIAGFKTFNNQVAGHLELRNKPCFLLDDDSHVLKMVDVTNPTGIIETAFFERIFNNDNEMEDWKELRTFLPQYYGLQQININGEKLCYLKLENLIAGFSKPSIMDIKIGQITSDPFADKSKIQREAMKYEYQTELGFRVLGCKAYKVKIGKTEFHDKSMCKKLTPDEIPELPERIHLVRRIIEKLKNLQNWFLHQKRVKFFSSSILIAYDGDATQYPDYREAMKAEYAENDDVIVRMIDFPHTYIDLGDSKSLDDNYSYGLRNLIRMFEELVEK
eukprot:Seg1393.13 transcript_id=Seg1393.13/GoldUCD/mRNA.D3Y31 product="Regulator of nonsense transcripts 3B" protein_id=Seg1393.13/GoldUCD/D3Y31